MLNATLHTNMIKVLDAKTGAKRMGGCSFYTAAKFGEMTTMATRRMKY